jgi:hypothetical protein
VSADPRSRRRRTLHPDQRALPFDELAAADALYGYAFIVTDLDVSTADNAAAVEHWYRHRSQIENIFRAAKLGRRFGTYRRDIRRSTPRGCGLLCSRPYLQPLIVR